MAWRTTAKFHGLLAGLILWSLMCSLVHAGEANLLTNLLTNYWRGEELVMPFIWIGSGILVLVLFIVGFICFLLHYLPAQDGETADGIPGTRSAAAAAQRLDAVVIDSFPLYSFPIEVGKDLKRADCSICLQEFADGDSVVALPVCRHFYHPECIRDWLINRSSRCPYCRYDYGGKGLLDSSSVA